MGTVETILLVFGLTYLVFGVIVLIVMLSLNPGFLQNESPDGTPPVLFGTAAVMLWWLILYFVYCEMKNKEANE